MGRTVYLNQHWGAASDRNTWQRRKRRVGKGIPSPISVQHTFSGALAWPVAQLCSTPCMTERRFYLLQALTMVRIFLKVFTKGSYPNKCHWTRPIPSTLVGKCDLVSYQGGGTPRIASGLGWEFPKWLLPRNATPLKGSRQDMLEI